MKYDIIIRGGTVLDGTGNPGYRADIGIKGRKIAAIATRLKGRGAKTIDATRRCVCPGFIEIHSHCDQEILDAPEAPNYIRQGVTTVVGGNCGFHKFPLRKLFGGLSKLRRTVNFGCYAGHGTIRKQVLGLATRRPSPTEMKRMCALLEREMRAGAMGLSSGLIYIPGRYSKSPELVRLAASAAKHGGLYASHIRSEGANIMAAVKEAILIGRKNRMPVEVSHVKLSGKKVWGKTSAVAALVEEARARGLDVTLDQYPYTASSTSLAILLPGWAMVGGKTALRERVQDPALRRKIRADMSHTRYSEGERLRNTYIARYRPNPKIEGKNLAEILRMFGKKPTATNGAQLVIDLETEGDASAVFFTMNEQDVESFMRLPYVMVGGDSRIQTKGRGVPHPRSYGTFARVIARYVREKKTIRLEDAIRKMTSLPAQTLRLNGRGLLKQGMYADMAVFDYARIADKATFQKPHQYAAGIPFVLVNGEPVVEKGRFTRARPGMILYGPGKV